VKKVAAFLISFAAIQLVYEQRAAAVDYTGLEGFVGAEVCGNCHQEEHRLWQGSHHDWAMKPATSEFVLGNFDNINFEHYGDQSRFFRQGEKFFVQTANAQGEPESFEVLYTFGFYPLQQYLVALSGGRLQALNIAWDSRPESEGGQRWFHLYPDEQIPHDDVLHWTGPYFTWNNRCASCHSTNLEKNYDSEMQRYDTTWSEINVACEACHGPGRDHIQWANSPDSSGGYLGLDRSLGVVGRWQRQQGESTAQLTQNVTPELNGQLATCGSCHSRRQLIDDPDKPGHFLDKHQIDLLNPPLYYSDGQIRDEVYVMGSFLQSKMFQQGVVCSNCHEPHSLELHAEGNAVCAQCHAPEVFDDAKHHHHQPGPGSQCVECHMPEQTYMVVDPRRDHSLRIPRPDLSVAYGTPNACTQCHQDQSNLWAAEAISEWLDQSGKNLPRHYGEDLAAALQGSTDAAKQLQSLAMGASAPGIVRATALSMLAMLADQSDPASVQTAYLSLKANDPLLRIGALRAFEALPAEERVFELLPLLEDPIKAVRLEATSLLTPVPMQALSDYQQDVLGTALEEYKEMLDMHADTSEGQFNLGSFYVDRANYPAGEQAFISALKLNPHNLAASMNLADLYRLIDRDDEGEPILHAAIESAPQQAGPYHSLGLLLVRQNNYDEAEEYLARATELAPENIRYGYVYAIALTSRGKVDQGLQLLSDLHNRQPTNLQILYALVDTNLRSKYLDQALFYAEKLKALQPQNPELDQLIQFLQ